MSPRKEWATVAAAFKNAPTQGTGRCCGLQTCTHARNGPLLRPSNMHPRKERAAAAAFTHAPAQGTGR
eukprot:6974640-Lingulodinium_polyedra.AAC.1